MAFIKDMVRMWLHAWKRFISIALISLLGVAVLTGIYAGCRDAFLATDRFFDTQGLHDIQVLSTAGLTDDDIAALRKVSGVAKVQGERSQTVTVDLNGKKTVTMQEIGTNGIGQPYLQSGRMPEKSGEIAVTRKFIKDSGYKKGDHITVTPQDSASSASSVSDSGESDNQTGENGSQMSDSGESDNKNGKSGTSNGASSNDRQLVWNAMYAKLKGSGESQAAYAGKLEDDDAVMKAVSCAHMAESFKFDLMGAVVALIVALAGGLALVVLFTLANTNVSEREREMATLKVLGFFDKEVHHYVNREMMVLTMMGVVLGLPLGRFVGGLLTAALNMPALYFEVECKPLSYVIAAVATMAFALLVQLLVNPVLDRIDPISSLKSVE